MQRFAFFALAFFLFFLGIGTLMLGIGEALPILLASPIVLLCFALTIASLNFAGEC